MKLNRQDLGHRHMQGCNYYARQRRQLPPLFLTLLDRLRAQTAAIIIIIVTIITHQERCTQKKTTKTENNG